MFPPPRHVLLLLVLAAGLRGQPSLDNAFRAQALLGPGAWSQVITVRNDTRGGVYPRNVHALIFELAGMLWFYTDANGTQSFSLHRDRVEEEKANILPLLLDIDPGFRHWTVEPPRSVPPAGGPLRNGCFVESVAALRDRVARGERCEQPRLLAYYEKSPSGQNGHTVLVYERGDVLEVHDPSQPTRAFVLPRALGADPLAVARSLDGSAIFKARYVPMRLGIAVEQMIAAARQKRDSVSAVVGL